MPGGPGYVPPPPNTTDDYLGMPEVVALLRKYGMTDPATLRTFVAICWAESGGKMHARNPVTGTHSDGTVARGLFQINTTQSEETTKHYDPDTNVKIAVGMQKDRGWQPWQAYADGSYKSYQVQAAQAVNAATDDGWSIGDVLPDLPKIPNPLDALSSGLRSIALEFAMPVGVALLGGLLLILGIWFLIGQTKAGKAAVSLGELALAPEAKGGSIAAKVASSAAAK